MRRSHGHVGRLKVLVDEGDRCVLLTAGADGAVRVHDLPGGAGAVQILDDCTVAIAGEDATEEALIRAWESRHATLMFWSPERGDPPVLLSGLAHTVADGAGAVDAEWEGETPALMLRVTDVETW